MQVSLRKYRALLVMTALTLVANASVFAAEPGTGGHYHGGVQGAVPPAFLTNRDPSYAALADDAMATMNDGMARAPVSGDADHDFAAMMIPHHQGAVDMAKAELLYGTDPMLRRLAQEIIVTQGQEIAVMQGALKKQPAAPAVDTNALTPHP